MTGTTSGSTTTAGSSTSGGSGSTTGGTGGGVGDPLPDAPAGEWLWVDIEGAQCRNGSQAGLAVRYSDTSSNVLIFFEGGGACYNPTTCLANPDSVDSGDKDGSNGGVFNVDEPSNPFADWNHVFIPYCTGDVFAGNNPGANVPGGGPQNQMFVGFVNTQLMLDRIFATFPDAESVAMTGSSAGGFGAAWNFYTAADRWGPAGAQMILLDDSGPPMDDAYMKPCLQQQWRDLWGLDDTLPQDCTECFHADGGGLVNLVTYYSSKYPDAYMSLVSSLQDSTIRGFFGYGANNCNAIVPFMSGSEYEMGLYDLRDNWMDQGGNWATFYITGSTHTWIGSNSRFYDTTVSGTVLVDWAADVVSGNLYHVAP
ncbi:MAG: hypothetical protein D6705_12495 [Deltaproteobacteria bacterium]|nr:MAG: hypothetical protein D6705_12495 [Deltaproteobacteria bacterium]